MHYHFLLVWRLLACLPPSVAYLDMLAAGTISMGNGYILHTLRWVPRLPHKVFTAWVKVGATGGQAGVASHGALGSVGRGGWKLGQNANRVKVCSRLFELVIVCVNIGHAL